MMMRLLIDFWILTAFAGSVALVLMVFTYMWFAFKAVLERLKKDE